MRKQYRSMVVILAFTMLIGGISAVVNGQPENENGEFQFPISENDATLRFTSFPDLFNWNIGYPQPGWEDAMDWFLGGMKTEGPAFSLVAGDIMDARWWSSKKQVRKKTNQYWGGFRKRFEDKNINLYIAPGDHEYGDDQGLRKMNLTPTFGKQFSKIFDMPRNGPEHKKGRAYSFTRKNLAVISVDTFEDAGDHMSMTVSGKQLEWLERQLKKLQDKDFIIVQGHVPVIGPVRSKNSSANMLEGGEDSAFWQTMVEYGVDAYFAGEHHRITVKKQDGIWQIVHGALWGTQTDPNYLRGSLWPDKLKLELFRFNVRYEGGYIGDHPHRGKTNRPREKVVISEEARKNGPDRVGELVIEAGEEENETTKTSGVFASLEDTLENRFALHSRTEWSVHADSVSEFNGKVPSNAIDGEPSTHWHTEWRDNKAPQPHHLIVDMGTRQDVGGFVYLPRQDHSVNGTITRYEFYVSDDPESFGQPVKTGTFQGNQELKAVRFDGSVKGRFLKLRSLKSVKSNPYASASELYVIKP